MKHMKKMMHHLMKAHESMGHHNEHEKMHGEHHQKAHTKKKRATKKIGHKELGISLEMHEAHKNDPGYQRRLGELKKHHKKGGIHPMEKEHSKMMKMSKKVSRMHHKDK